uniref:Pollen-specific protein C13 n=1 Tax=Zea mays TaxID=4577 RepID=A0A804MGZ1_MAIZE
MASIPATTFAVILSVLFCAAAGTAVDNDLPDYVIQGRVYCDTCRAGFVTNVTEYIAGAKVRLECKHFGTGKLERSICEVVLVESPRKDCDQVQADRDRAGVLLTRNVGISDNLRPANPLGYLKDVPLPICASLLKQLDSDDDDDQ